MATVISMPIAGAIAGSSYGWPMIFYFFGLLAIIWCVYYMIFGANCPRAHKSITQEERAFIVKTVINPNTKQVSNNNVTFFLS